ncbi:IS3 family transposase [Metaclostridioides mangenotii]|uniref:IS3 family transposase n=1 Tax=Metaclostridioides mangenotii TaxID=1540 RepID=UPI0028E29FBE|nr:IS3 family transposase [Clostridioides mangenotii]
MNRKPIKRDLENEVLSSEIKEIFEEHKKRYGSLRISKALEQKGIKVNRKRVAKLMRKMELYAKGGSVLKMQIYNVKAISPAVSNGYCVSNFGTIIGDRFLILIHY